MTTGASNDIQRATDIARKMVTQWGLSEKMGPLMYDDGGEEVFLGRSAAQQQKGISDETAKNIDEEIRNIVDECYSKAEKLLNDNLDKLHAMAEALILYETISSDQIDDIMEGREPREPDDWSGDDQDQTTVEKEKSRSSSASTGPIGGPAGEH